MGRGIDSSPRQEEIYKLDAMQAYQGYWWVENAVALPAPTKLMYSSRQGH